MLGAIIGDMVGAPWEFRRITTKDFPLFNDRNGITDDSIMTVAVADALLHDKDPAETMREWARKVRPAPHLGGYGKKFFSWLAAPTVQAPYGSFGNGGAMRVSPVAWLTHSLDECLESARKVTEVSHDHPEGLKGALATAHAVWLARQGVDAAEIRAALESAYGYDLSPSVDGFRSVHEHNETAPGTVPPAIVCALESEDFEDALRNAVSMGGDADTLAAIAGSVAESLHGIPDVMIESALPHIPAVMREVISVFDSGR
ncbi:MULTISPECIES: ADP-ribosylglycohydrolase family protein [unclassified Thioalkalivibrio]|uniref:ADP-ribosylglycohydrolase family protein n=1 Tax=unclassified Thioalkalivibrio TaxID=2621013 RepID=UPI00039E0BCB|nr:MULTISPECIES: ADP-ribosylglycohydrolase family protein [unclassified Thioalkalivibrio]